MSASLDVEGLWVWTRDEGVRTIVRRPLCIVEMNLEGCLGSAAEGSGFNVLVAPSRDSRLRSNLKAFRLYGVVCGEVLS